MCIHSTSLYVSEKPLNLWSKHISQDGKIRRLNDDALNGDKVVEIMGPHETPVPTNISCPSNPTEVLHIKLPVLVLVVKNLELKFKLEFQLVDKKGYRRKFTLTTYNHEKLPIADMSAACLSLKLEEGWNNLEINFQLLCSRTYGVEYEALQRIIIYPNCRIRRVHLQDRHYGQEEIPVELIQAFFDMYMLKWGIHLVERSSQTEESETGPLQPCDLVYFTTDSTTSVLMTASSPVAFNDTNKRLIERPVNKNRNIVSNLTNEGTVVFKKNSKSVNELWKEVKIASNVELGRMQSNVRTSITNYSVNIPIEKKEVTNSRGQKEMMGKNGQVQTSGTNMKYKNLNEHDSLIKSFPYIEKSEYLKIQICKNFGNEPSKDRGLIFQELPTNYTSVDNSIDKNISKNVAHMKSKAITKVLKPHTSLKNFSSNFAMQKNKCLAISKQNVESYEQPNIDSVLNKSKIKESRSRLKTENVKTIKNIIGEVQRIREELNHQERNIQKLNIKSQNELSELSQNVPDIVEVQSKSSDGKPKETVLATDQAVGNFLELRHKINKKLLEKLHNKGLTMTEIELSIYNSKNRRNSYGQGKLIKSHKGCISKGTGLSRIKALEVDMSLKREQLVLNDKMCMELRNELDTTLLELNSTHVRITPDMVEDTVGKIINSTSRISNAPNFPVSEIELFKEKMLYADERNTCDENMIQNCSSLKEDKIGCDIIEGTEKYNEVDAVNVLFQRQSCLNKHEFGAVR
ncbi:uncharacterized protein LOC107263952 isoform X2 [Cephus cinctus]|uniref:Uncharacterized protein LOC107263952 isoform X2 n=1 Tax=Cephus cinctus TaxID=211228 RepID=A0AAJ7BJX8_CEPCN|nr:uncharacterized protein LOC107263952 isoform X2 [Cephus cinctus]